MNTVDLITKKRDGGEHTQEEIRWLVRGIVEASIPDYQLAAWAMAVFFQGMTEQETIALTLAMAENGPTNHLHDGLPSGSRIVDKHSTGGVGDKTTLAVGPMVAACGLPVGKVSGRGLSYTGGTIDKLESIQGWNPDLDQEAFRRQLQEVGLVVSAQTADLAPADRRLYALRDVTGTVPSLPLIAASIMSKKLAAGADAIVLDVKCGRGAFMQSLERAQELARLMVVIGQQSGRRITALITQIDQPLGRAVGNALEVREAIESLHGRGPDDFQELAEAVAAEMVALGRVGQSSADTAIIPADALKDARNAVRQSIDSGAAFEKFKQFVLAQGGEVAQVEEPDRLPTAPVVIPVLAVRSGIVQQIDARSVGLAVVAMGGGRHRKGDSIDHRVGLVCQVKVGEPVERDDPLCLIHAASVEQAQAVEEQLQAAYVIDEKATPRPAVILDRLSLAG